MPGSITLPQIVLDLEEEDRKSYEALKAPKAIVVRYGYMRMVAELPYDGEAKPGCGSKLVIRTRRGIEMGEMLTTTCGNGGCGKSVSRKQMLEYIDNSGGKDYPFSTDGRVLRVATVEDLNEQSRLDSKKMAMIRFTRELIRELDLPMKLVDVELLLGGERVMFHYTAEQWIDFRELVRRLASEYQTRIEMHQVNARDEARITADYEKCGQHCCCKQFLKVLKPVSMRSAKVQKATLDPTKISGRCGRLMCCLRYEDETYESLRKKLPNRQTRVMTDDGPGTVLDSQILTQLILVRLDNAPKPAAYPLENLEILAKDHPNYKPPLPPAERPERGERRGPGGGGPRPAAGPRSEGRTDGPRSDGRGGGGGSEQIGGAEGDRSETGVAGAPAAERTRGDRPRDERGPRRPKPGAPLRGEEVESADGTRSDALPDAETEPALDGGLEAGDGPTSEGAEAGEVAGGEGQAGQEGTGEGKRRRRRRRRRGRGKGPDAQGQGGGGNSNPGGNGPSGEGTGGGGSGGNAGPSAPTPPTV